MMHVVSKHASSQRGYYMMGLAITLLAVSIATLGNARSTIQAFKTTIGQKIGNELNAVRNGLDAYIQSNTTALLAGAPIAGVAVANSPTVAELKGLKFLSAGIATTPMSGTAYKTSVWVVNNSSTASTTVKGTVSLVDPVYSSDGSKTDLRLLSAAADVSPSGQIGFSKMDAVLPKRAQKIYFPTGASMANPDVLKRPGILAATTEQNSNNNLFWQSALDRSNSFPAANTLYDGRLLKENNRPYIYDGANASLNMGWKELFSSGSASTSVSIGQGAAVENPASPTMRHNVHLGMHSGAGTGALSTAVTITGGSANNTLVGHEAGKTTTGDALVFIGQSSGYADVYGSRNAYLGAEAAMGSTFGQLSTVAGYQAASNAKNLDSVVALGARTGPANTKGKNLVLLGTNSGKSNITGYANVFNGTNAGLANLDGSQSVLTGYNAGANNTYSNDNVSTGYAAGSSAANYGQRANVLIGSNSGAQLKMGSSDVCIGFEACKSTSNGSDNIAIGSKSGANQLIGNSNQLLGAEAGFSLGSTATTDNTFIGYQAGKHHTTGSTNTFVGTRAGAMNQAGDTLIAIGMDAHIPDNLKEAIAIGYGAMTTSSFSVQFGNHLVSRIGGAVPWSSDSDRRLKTNIQDTERGLAFVRQLRPVDYTLLASQKKETGFIAQEVEAIDTSFPGIHKPQDSHDYYSVSYTDFIPAIVKAIQTLDAQTSVMPAQPHHPHSHQLAWFLSALFVVLLGLVTWLFQRNYHLFKAVKLLKQALHHPQRLPTHP